MLVLSISSISSVNVCADMQKMYKDSSCCGGDGESYCKSPELDLNILQNKYKCETPKALERMKSVLVDMTTENVGWLSTYKPTAAMGVSKNGEMLLEASGIKNEAKDPFTPNTLIPLSSVSKVIGSILLTRLMTLGYITSPFQEVRELVPLLDKQLFTNVTGVVTNQPHWTFRDFTDEATGQWMDGDLCKYANCTVAHNKTTLYSKYLAVLHTWTGQIDKPVGTFSYQSGTAFWLAFIIQYIVNTKDGTSLTFDEIGRNVFHPIKARFYQFGGEHFNTTGSSPTYDFLDSDIKDMVSEFLAVDSNDNLKLATTKRYAWPSASLKNNSIYQTQTSVWRFNNMDSYFAEGTTEVEKMMMIGGTPSTNGNYWASPKSVLTALTALANDGTVNGIQFLDPDLIKLMWHVPNPRILFSTYPGSLKTDQSSVFASSCAKPGINFDYPSSAPYMLGTYQQLTPKSVDMCAWGGWVGTKFSVYRDAKVALFSWGTRRNELGGQVPDAHGPISALMAEASKELDAFNVWNCHPPKFTDRLYSLSN